MQKLKKNRLSEDSKRLLAHIKVNGPQTLQQLRPLTGENESNLIKRLRNLRTGGWLVVVDGAPVLSWNICAAAAPLFDQGLAAKRSKTESKPMGEMPLPRQIRVMDGHYVPTPFTPARSGSLDFSSIASRGVRC
ncbi:hypothetical protein [Comamonas resistens]|uniref:hypothetical protein n=1 Tax=Comamonas resistens TaxID=3046670 RepID=UPI0039BC94B1